MKFSQIKYVRPDFESLFLQLDSHILNFKAANDAEEQFDVYRRFNILIDGYNTQFALARIRNYLNTSDEFYRTEVLLFSQNTPILFKKSHELNDLLLNSNFEDELIKKIGKLIFTDARLFESSFNDSIIDEQREEKRMVLEYVKLLSTLSVDWNGEKIPLPLLASYKESIDRDIRLCAYTAEGECYDTVKSELDELFDRLVKNRTDQAKKLGFKNFVQLGYKRMRRSCYDSKDVKLFREQVKSEVVPVVQRILTNRCERLGLDSLCFHDLLLSHSDGSPKPQSDIDTLITFGKKMYSEMSPQTREFIELMIDNELFDLHPRIGKSPGGFCSFIKDYNCSFIFANLNGTAYDVNVFTHEVGHAFANFISNKQTVSNYQPTMEVSESCSMSMEFLTKPWHGMFFGKDIEKYHQKHLEDSIIFMPYACQVDEFQHYIYENPNLTPSQRDSAWLEIEGQYRPGTNYCGLPFYSNGSGWQRQTHIYKSPFYYIDYALAQVTALNFYIAHLENPEETFDRYMCFLNNIDRYNYTELLNLVGFGSPFKENNLNSLMDNLSRLL